MQVPQSDGGLAIARIDAGSVGIVQPPATDGGTISLPGASAPEAPQTPQIAAVEPATAPVEIPVINTAPSSTPPVVVSEPATASLAPTAATDEIAELKPTVLDAPETSGVLASLARSNTVFGATLNAARALFAPSEALVRPVTAPAGAAAPRPREQAVVASLAEPSQLVISDAANSALPAALQAPTAPQAAPRVIQLASLSPDVGYSPIVREDLALGSSFRPAARAPLVAVDDTAPEHQ